MVELLHLIVVVEHDTPNTSPWVVHGGGNVEEFIPTRTRGQGPRPPRHDRWVLVDGYPLDDFSLLEAGSGIVDAANALVELGAPQLALDGIARGKIIPQQLPEHFPRCQVHDVQASHFRVALWFLILNLQQDILAEPKDAINAHGVGQPLYGGRNSHREVTGIPLLVNLGWHGASGDSHIIEVDLVEAIGGAQQALVVVERHEVVAVLIGHKPLRPTMP